MELVRAPLDFWESTTTPPALFRQFFPAKCESATVCKILMRMQDR